MMKKENIVSVMKIKIIESVVCYKNMHAFERTESYLAH